jgi:mannose-6-phosphate isomerase-like protein (cupin superfamily)
MKRLTTTTKKPWGSFSDLATHDGVWLVKTIFVKKGARLSLQKHTHRAEMWIVVEGKASVQRGKTKKTLLPKECIFIKKSQVHRLTAQSDLTVVEVSFGPHRERDIVRLADDFHRTKRPKQSRK